MASGCLEGGKLLRCMRPWARLCGAPVPAWAARVPAGCRNSAARKAALRPASLHREAGCG